MSWTANGEAGRRTPGEQGAYVAGFHAGVGQAIESVAQDKPLDRLLDLAALMEECVAEDNEAANADPDR
jgi:hypothetical protein